MRSRIEGVQYLQCVPGSWVLTLLTECKGQPIGVDRNLIIALAFEADSMVPIPVTWDGAVQMDYAIQQPAGDVYVPGAGEAFETPEEWFADCKRKWEVQQRYEAFMRESGVDVTSETPAQSTGELSPGRAGIQAALAAARDAQAAKAGKVSS